MGVSNDMHFSQFSRDLCNLLGFTLTTKTYIEGDYILKILVQMEYKCAI